MSVTARSKEVKSVHFSKNGREAGPYKLLIDFLYSPSFYIIASIRTRLDLRALYAVVDE